MVCYVFKRYELKYRLTVGQYRAVRAEIDKRLSPDAFGETTIQSLYYDTADNRLVRASLEKPMYKEKLRLRCYGLNDSDKDVYLEMKRKYDGIVYKRRISCKEQEVNKLFAGKYPDSQIGKELGYFLDFYGELLPKILILYDRAAFLDTEGDLRVTFDRNIRYRTAGLDFQTSLKGEKLLPEDTVLMELKCGMSLPLWLCNLLCRENIQKQSFSKYGTAYEREYRKAINSRREALCLNPFFVTEMSPQPASLSF